MFSGVENALFVFLRKIKVMSLIFPAEKYHQYWLKVNIGISNVCLYVGNVR